MEPEFSLTGMEIIFLGAAFLVTIPMLIFLRWVLKEMKKESLESTAPGTTENPGESLKP